MRGGEQAGGGFCSKKKTPSQLMYGNFVGYKRRIGCLEDKKRHCGAVMAADVPGMWGGGTVLGVMSTSLLDLWLEQFNGAFWQERPVVLGCPPS